MDLGLKNKTALVLAGGGGLGRAIAKALAAEGARVAVAGIGAKSVAGTEAELRTRLRAPQLELTQLLFHSAPLKQTGRVMVKDENLCVHCGLCAERCPTAAWDMQKSTIHWPQAADGDPVCPSAKLKTA